MGFWSSFLGHAAANTYNEIKKDEKETQRWNDLFHELGEYETKFQNYLESIDCPDVYIADVEYVNNGNIMPAKREMDNLRKKCEEYISLGGQGKYLYRLEDIDDYIEKVKFLKANGCLHRQIDFCQNTSYEVREKIAKENKMKNRQESVSVGTTPQTSSLEYQGELDLNETFEITGVRVWDNSDQQFYEFTVRIVYNSEVLNVYLEGIPGEPFEGNGKLLGSFPTSVDSYCNVGISDLDDPNHKIVRYGQSVYVMNTEDALKFKAFQDKLDLNVDKVMCEKQESIIELSSKIEGIDILAKNLIDTMDTNILLNHDLVIMMQMLWSYDRMRSVKLYDEDATSNETMLTAVALVQTLLENMVEIVLEDNDISEKEAKFACWEAIKRASIKYYANVWEASYGKFIDEPLKQCETTEADGTIDKYIEEIVLCNEIESTDNYDMIATFTYYMMDKGYTKGKPYFPAYFDLMIKAFSVIGSNMKKRKIKEQLRGNVVKHESHYTVDDIDMMNGNEFEHFVCELYQKMGYSAEVTKQSGDQGLDVIAEKNGKRIGIQAKCYSGTVGNSVVQEAVAGKSFYHCDKVVVVTNNYFTSSAIELAQANDVILWNRDILKEKIKELI